jgi:peptide/nickel transport system substrate-binding protein
MSKLNSKKMWLFSVFTIIAMVAAACQAAPTPTALPVTGGGTATPAPTSAPTGAGTQGATSAPTAAPTSGPTAAPTAAIKNPGTLVYGVISDPQSLDPAWAYDTASGGIIQNVYETLIFYNKSSATEFVPMLATKWDISPDGKTYTFTIRTGVTFQDGSPLTPEDVAYSFWRGMIQDRAGGPQWIMLQPFFGLNVQSFQNDVVKTQFGGNWVAAAQAVEKAVTYDNAADTVTLHLKQPYGPMLQILAGTWASILSMPWVIKQGGWDGNPADAQKYHDPAANADELFKVMNGTGPFKLQRWAPGQEVDLVRNDNYWVTQPLWPGGPTGPAKLQSVIIKTIPEWGTRFAEFQTGDLDMAQVDTQFISQIDPMVHDTCDVNGNCTTTNPNGQFRLYKNLPSVEETTVFFNQNVNTTGGNATIGSGKLDGNGVPANFFSDIHIRQAFNYCFDWSTYIKQTYNGEATQAYGPIISGELGFDPNQAHYSFDLTKCADAFKASTLKSPTGQSLWDTGFYLQFIYNTGNEQRHTAGEILAQNLLKVNPKFHLAVVDEPFPLELSDQTAGRLAIFMIGWLEDYHDPQDWVVPFLASGGTYAGTQAFDPTLQKQMDSLINQGITATDQTQRASIYSQLQNLSYQNALDIFVVQPLIRHYEQMWVTGWYYNPTYNDQYFYPLNKGL